MTQVKKKKNKKKKRAQAAQSIQTRISYDESLYKPAFKCRNYVCFPSTPKCRVATENTQPYFGDHSNLLVPAEEIKGRRNTGSYL